MSGYRWRCKTEGCDWTGPDARAVLVHRQKAGHVGAQPESLPRPCRCDHCTGAWEQRDICDCGHPLARHSRPFHSCSWCLWCDEFQTRRPFQATEETQ